MLSENHSNAPNSKVNLCHYQNLQGEIKGHRSNPLTDEDLKVLKPNFEIMFLCYCELKVQSPKCS